MFLLLRHLWCRNYISYDKSLNPMCSWWAHRATTTSWGSIGYNLIFQIVTYHKVLPGYLLYHFRTPTCLTYVLMIILCMYINSCGLCIWVVPAYLNETPGRTYAAIFFNNKTSFKNILLIRYHISGQIVWKPNLQIYVGKVNWNGPGIPAALPASHINIQCV